jgi:hypothetical protein
MPNDTPQDPRDDFFASFDNATDKVVPVHPAVPPGAGPAFQSRKLFTLDRSNADARQPIEFSCNGTVASGSSEIGGLLPFVVCIVILSPLASFALILIEIRLLAEGVWAARTTPGSAQYYVLAAPLITTMLTLQIGFLAALIFNVRLYFCKSRFFPNFFITLMLVGLCLPLLCAWLASFAWPSNPLAHTDWASTLAWPLLRAVILVPYLMLSEQVRTIFIE